jgi:hypothetical protein
MSTEPKETDASLLSPEKIGSTVSQLKIKIKETLNTDSNGLTRRAACMQVNYLLNYAGPLNTAILF